MEPTVGRIVHYQSYGTPDKEFIPEPYAALIVKLDGNGAHLAVFYDNGVSFKPNVSFSEEPSPGHWNWPPRV
jgi:hypothetical protein